MRKGTQLVDDERASGDEKRTEDRWDQVHRERRWHWSCHIHSQHRLFCRMRREVEGLRWYGLGRNH